MIALRGGSSYRTDHHDGTKIWKIEQLPTTDFNQVAHAIYRKPTATSIPDTKGQGEPAPAPTPTKYVYDVIEGHRWRGENTLYQCSRAIFSDQTQANEYAEALYNMCIEILTPADDDDEVSGDGLRSLTVHYGDGKPPYTNFFWVEKRELRDRADGTTMYVPMGPQDESESLLLAPKK
ncbi:uncharacterized protein LTR77_003793 [Saxophila tyrrhenica]|uniref:Uncharacterized protein n=1 Tax=Saxophila tyrrhenica TaxID=1690608 RepID=A0AAV9PEN5_9PEZI|nr:hypothetical protein LTR77_003793 [Saxophila tyrrhenica]